MREVLGERLPQAEDVEVAGAYHALAVTHPDQVAQAIHAGCIVTRCEQSHC